jgi:hypothetical protein
MATAVLLIMPYVPGENQHFGRLHVVRPPHTAVACWDGGTSIEWPPGPDKPSPTGPPRELDFTN